ncbi:hypothetical protein ACU8KH_00498 [Lachancea thermotolerans]
MHQQGAGVCAADDVARIQTLEAAVVWSVIKEREPSRTWNLAAMVAGRR